MEKLVEEIRHRFKPKIRPIEWRGDRLVLLDQRVLPFETRYIEAKTVAEVAEAIRDMVVRGAPAIGITAAFGMVVALKEKKPKRGATHTGLREGSTGENKAHGGEPLLGA